MVGAKRTHIDRQLTKPANRPFFGEPAKKRGEEELALDEPDEPELAQTSVT